MSNPSACISMSYKKMRSSFIGNRKSVCCNGSEKQRGYTGVCVLPMPIRLHTVPVAASHVPALWFCDRSVRPLWCSRTRSHHDIEMKAEPSKGTFLGFILGPFQTVLRGEAGSLQQEFVELPLGFKYLVVAQRPDIINVHCRE